MKIIGISGKKQSGKNTFANYVNGSILKKYGLVDDFSINKEGQLQEDAEEADEGEGVQGPGEAQEEREGEGQGGVLLGARGGAAACAVRFFWGVGARSRKSYL